MRDKQSVLAVLGVLLVVVGFVWVANRLTAKPAPVAQATPDPSASASDAPSASESAPPTATPTPTPTPTTLPGCTPVPALQTSPKKFSTPPDVEAVRGRAFVATITTNCGPITVELDGAKAPATVSSFVKLATEGYWAPSPCHRLTTDTDQLWVLQCGDPTGTGSGPGPGYHFGIENAPADGSYPRGTLAMARTSDPNSNGDQFFITYKDTTLPASTGGYSIFGRVTSGMEIVDRVAAAGVSPTDSMTPMAQISILSVAATPKG
ncbi:MAG: peptidylprolyl isomerase [Dermatophilaceae bacterium]